MSRTIFDVIARDNATPGLMSANRSMQTLGGSALSTQGRIQGAGRGMRRALGGMGKDMATLAVGGGLIKAGGGIVNALGDSVDAAGKFGQGLAAVGAVTKASTSELKGLEKAAIDAGIATQFSPTEAMEGLQSLATAGQKAAQASETLVPVLDLAAGSMGQLGVAGAAEAVVGTLNAYGKAAGEAGGVTDDLLRITQLTNFQTRDFGIGLSKAAATGAVFGQKLDDVLITMGLLRNRNIDASSSATAVRESLRRLGSDMGAQQQVQKAGVNVFDKQTGKMRSAIDIISDLADKTSDMTDKQRQEIVARAFGARGLLAFNAVSKATFTTMKDGAEVTLKGREAIAALRKEMANTTGTADAFRKKLLSTFEGQRTLLKGTLETLSVTFGKPLAEMLAPIVGGVTDTLNTFIKLFDALPPIAQKVIVGITGVTGVMMKLMGVVILLKGAMNLMGISFGGLLLTMGKVLLVGAPIIALLAGIGVGFIGLNKAANRNIGGIGNTWSNMWGKAKIGFQGVIDLFSSGKLSSEVQKELEKSDNQGVSKFLVNMTGFIGKVKRFWRGMVIGFEEGLSKLRGPFDEFRDTMQNMFGIFLGGSEDSATSLLRWEKNGNKVGESLAELSGIALRFATSTMDTLSQSFGDLKLEDITDGFKTMLDAVIALSEGILFLSDMKVYFGSLFTAEDELTKRQMLAHTTAVGGLGARKTLQKQFENIALKSELGFKMEGGREQTELKAFQFTKGVGAIGLLDDELGVTARKRVDKSNEKQEALLTDMKAILEHIRRNGSLPTVMTIDGRRFGTEVGRSQNTEAEEGFSEMDIPAFQTVAVP